MIHCCRGLLLRLGHGLKMALTGRIKAQILLTSVGRPWVCQFTTSSCQHGPERSSRLSDDASMAAMKRGGGFRSSFSGVVATVFGASGSAGRGVCNRLGKIGSQMILPYHGEFYDFQRLKTCGDLGQVLFTPYNLKDEESIRLAMKHSNVVINLTGRTYETRNFKFSDINVEAPARLARIAKEMGVERFVHMSHINAREQPERAFMPKGSTWLRTKWLGEQRVLEEFPDATIIRSSDVIGERDFFCRYFLSYFRQGLYGRIPLWGKGESTIKAPIYKTDVAKAVINCLGLPEAKGTTYEVIGPHYYLLSDLIDYMYISTLRTPEEWGYKRTDLRYSPVAFAKALAGQLAPIGKTAMGFANLDLLERSSISDDVLGLPSAEDLDVKPVNLLEKLPHELKLFKAFGDWYPMPEDNIRIAEDPVPLTRVEINELRSMSRTGLLKAISG